LKSKREYVIPFVGLKTGTHHFDFEIDDSFFEDLEYSMIHSGKLQVKLELEKKETMLIGNYFADGVVTVECDRCNDPVEISVHGDFQLIYKFGTETSDDENLIVLHPDEYEIDVKDSIYELITVNLPSKFVHPEGECNEEMIEILNQYALVENDDEDWEDDEDDQEDEDWDDDEGDDDGPIDPRWSALKNLN
jgi:uncharacterized protein